MLPVQSHSAAAVLIHCTMHREQARHVPCPHVNIDSSIGYAVASRLAVEGTGFLYKQVRHMTGALLAVGTGKLDPRRIQQLLEAGDAAAPPGEVES